MSSCFDIQPSPCLHTIKPRSFGFNTNPHPCLFTSAFTLFPSSLSISCSAEGHGLGAGGRREADAGVHDLSEAVRPGHAGGTHMVGTAAPAIKPK